MKIQTDHVTSVTLLLPVAEYHVVRDMRPPLHTPSQSQSSLYPRCSAAHEMFSSCSR